MIWKRPNEYKRRLLRAARGLKDNEICVFIHSLPGADTDLAPAAVKRLQDEAGSCVHGLTRLRPGCITRRRAEARSVRTVSAWEGLGQEFARDMDKTPGGPPATDSANGNGRRPTDAFTDNVRPPLLADEALQHEQSDEGDHHLPKGPIGVLSLGALGVFFNDTGTSEIYTMMSTAPVIAFEPLTASPWSPEALR